MSARDPPLRTFTVAEMEVGCALYCGHNQKSWPEWRPRYRHSVTEVLEPEMSDEEREGLRKSADTTGKRW